MSRGEVIQTTHPEHPSHIQHLTKNPPPSPHAASTFAPPPPINLLLCFSAHSLLAILPLSAASALALFAASSFSLLSSSLASFSSLSLLKTSLPFIFSAAASEAETVRLEPAFSSTMLLRFEDVAEELETVRERTMLLRLAELIMDVGRWDCCC